MLDRTILQLHGELAKGLAKLEKKLDLISGVEALQHKALLQLLIQKGFLENEDGFREILGQVIEAENKRVAQTPPPPEITGA